jgi:hypothetical protein
MNTHDRSHAAAAHALFEGEDVRDVLRDTFFRSEPEPGFRSEPDPAPAAVRKPRRAKPPSRSIPKEDLPYEVICISLYREDLAELDEKVRALKARGHRKMSRSALIRYALAQVDTSALPRSW